MQNKKILGITILCFLLIQIISACEAKLKTTVWSGYLIDKHCFGKKEPDKETKECLSMDVCEASGFGVAVKDNDGKFKFYKFDEKGDKLAKDIPKESKNNYAIAILVKGIDDKEKIKVSTISEK